ncbi:DUF445 family protein [Jeotgalibacillus sp. ET6]|uniref:DUF445 domain-containing protein n=1 Tax=Jeotgalibacillus sp. ET6 TaxID=3037260 RepID=UPI002418979A|nr:DUF445 family protein [Jeotgalibacillus sp. ET6]MDG5473395.1 DUF445 family protein [Jeotgalibacillus sp. ET6]
MKKGFVHALAILSAILKFEKMMSMKGEGSMDTFVLLMIMMAVGAAIGGFTNSLAIKMLFRPYKAMYIGKWRIPFTPGLIPKRREELARQLGLMVVNHLLTAQSLKDRFLNEKQEKALTGWLQKESDRVFQSEESVEAWLAKFEIESPAPYIERSMNSWLESQYEEVKEKYKTRTLRETLPERWLVRLDGKVETVSDYILAKGTDYFASEEGKERINIMIEDFFKTRGTLGSMIQMVMGNSSLVDKVQPEIIKFLNHKGTHAILEQVLRKEWESVKDWQWDRAFSIVTDQDLLVRMQGLMKERINLSEWLKRPLADAAAPLHEGAVNRLIPRGVEMARDILSQKLEQLLSKMNLQEIVREQVDSFEVSRLEELVLGISRREFKMITYLGALLGGIIGLFQGVLVLLIG